MTQSTPQRGVLIISVGCRNPSLTLLIVSFTQTWQAWYTNIPWIQLPVTKVQWFVLRSQTQCHARLFPPLAPHYLPHHKYPFLHSFSKDYFREGVEYRSLIKAYGILFNIEVTGQVDDTHCTLQYTTADCSILQYIKNSDISCPQGGKFDFSTLFLKLGSMIALLGIVSSYCLCDVWQMRDVYVVH